MENSAELARSLAALANDVIVLGGGISNINSLYDELPELIGRHALSDGIRTRVEFGPLAGTPAASEERRGCGLSRRPRKW